MGKNTQPVFLEPWIPQQSVHLNFSVMENGGGCPRRTASRQLLVCPELQLQTCLPGPAFHAGPVGGGQSQGPSRRMKITGRQAVPSDQIHLGPGVYEDFQVANLAIGPAGGYLQKQLIVFCFGDLP